MNILLGVGIYVGTFIILFPIVLYIYNKLDNQQKGK